MGLTEEALTALRDEALADDLAIDMAKMADWTEAEARVYFESGGSEEPAPRGAAPEAAAGPKAIPGATKVIHRGPEDAVDPSAVRMRLLCVPQAGTGSFIYHGWQKLLPPWLEVAPVEIPGRFSRRTEPVPRTWKDMVAELCDELEASGVLDKPYVLFGHSFGAWQVFEIACELVRRGAPAPHVLVVGGARPPHLAALEHDPDKTTPAIAHFPSKAFWKHFERRYGRNPDLADATIRKMIEAPVRNDFALIESYKPTRESGALPCRVVAIAAEGDNRVDADQLKLWDRFAPPDRFTEKWFKTAVEPWSNAHRFVIEDPRELQQFLVELAHAELRMIDGDSAPPPAPAPAPAPAPTPAPAPAPAPTPAPAPAATSAPATAPPPAAAPAAGRKLRILCLHSFRANAKIMQKQLQIAGQLGLLHDVAQLSFLDAPHVPSAADDGDVSLDASDPLVVMRKRDDATREKFFPTKMYGEVRVWFTAALSGTAIEDGPEFVPCEHWSEAIASVEAALADAEPPYDGLMGFSQGGAVAAAVVARQEQRLPDSWYPRLQFVWLQSSRCPRDPSCAGLLDAPMRIPALVSFAVDDPSTKAAETRKLASKLSNATVLSRAKGGHAVMAVTKAEHQGDAAVLRAWMLARQAEANAGAGA